MIIKINRDSKIIIIIIITNQKKKYIILKANDKNIYIQSKNQFSHSEIVGSA